MAPHKMLLLHPGSTGGSTAAQAGNTTRCRDLFAAKKLSYLEVDGSNPTEKEVRDKLFGISGVRGNYPQIFKCKGGDIECAEFIGCWDKIGESSRSGFLHFHDLSFGLLPLSSPPSSLPPLPTTHRGA